MAAPSILAMDLSGVVYTAADEVAGHPATNLNDYSLLPYWGGVDLPNSITADLGASVEFDTVVLAGHNFPDAGADGAVTLQAADDAGFSTGVVSIVSDLRSHAEDPVYVTFSAITKRYVRVKYEATISAELPRLAKFFVGTRLQFARGYNWGYKRNNAQYVTTEKTALSGLVRTAQSFAGRLMWELRFTLQSDTFAAAFQQFVQAVRGKLLPFWFIDSDGTTVEYLQLADDYVPVQGDKYNVNSIQVLKMRTQQSTH